MFCSFLLRWLKWPRSTQRPETWCGTAPDHSKKARNIRNILAKLSAQRTFAGPMSASPTGQPGSHSSHFTTSSPGPRRTRPHKHLRSARPLLRLSLRSTSAANSFSPPYSDSCPTFLFHPAQCFPLPRRLRPFQSFHSTSYCRPFSLVLLSLRWQCLPHRPQYIPRSRVARSSTRHCRIVRRRRCR